ncbi:MAG: L,D-transpeptidase family protein [Chitinophagales bacterium]
MFKYIVIFVTIFSLLVVDSRSAMTNSHLRQPRVQAAKDATDARLRQLFEEKGLAYPPQNIFMRVLKSENLLEMWVWKAEADQYQLLKTYGVCAMSGYLGPKRKQGDYQVPEGFYHLSSFNPWSAYHLSMKINYPNKSDRILSPHRNLGGDIFIHGYCGSLGCVSITDPLIQEVYWLSLQAKQQGQKKIPVHIFPAYFSDLKYNLLHHLYAKEDKLTQLWNNLYAGFSYFETKKQVPKMGIDDDGHYYIIE